MLKHLLIFVLFCNLAFTLIRHEPNENDHGSCEQLNREVILKIQQGKDTTAKIIAVSGNPDPCKVYCQLETVDPGSKTTPINSTANASDYSPCAPEPSPHTAGRCVNGTCYVWPPSAWPPTEIMG